MYAQKPESPNDFIIKELTNIAESKLKKQPVGVAPSWANETQESFLQVNYRGAISILRLGLYF